MPVLSSNTAAGLAASVTVGNAGLLVGPVGSSFRIVPVRVDDVPTV